MDDLVTLDGSAGEGGGQILRTALSLSLLTGRAFRIDAIRARRPKPGLRPQHMQVALAAARLGGEVVGATVGSSTLTFRPKPLVPQDLAIEIGTAGASALVLHTLHLPMAMRAEKAVRLTIGGGTFNETAPSFPYLAQTWRPLMAAIGLPVALAMPAAGFYPGGGGRLEAWIEPARPSPLTLSERGPLRSIRGTAGVSGLPPEIARRMADRASRRLSAMGFAAEIEVLAWPGPSPGAALSLSADFDRAPATFLGLGARGKPAEAVADEAADQLLAHLAGDGALDPHAADQVLLPLAMAEGPSVYTVAAATEHLRTNARTIAAFLGRGIRVVEAEGTRSARVEID